jgi:hypothetical protein
MSNTLIPDVTSVGGVVDALAVTVKSANASASARSDGCGVRELFVFGQGPYLGLENEARTHPQPVGARWLRPPIAFRLHSFSCCASWVREKHGIENPPMKTNLLAAVLSAALGLVSFSALAEPYHHHHHYHHYHHHDYHHHHHG